MKIFAAGSLLLSCAFLPSASLRAEILTVTSLADSGEGTLRAAIAAAADEDTIQISLSGSIDLQSTLRLARPVTIQGRGSDELTVRGGGPMAKFSVFEIRERGGITLKNLTITGGYAKEGGAINASTDGPIVLEDCLLLGNQDDGSGGGGGAIHLHGGTQTTIRCCVLQSNTSRGTFGTYPGGGAICVSKATLLLEDSSVVGNTSAGFGGGVHINAGTAEARNCTFSGNTSSRSGSAIGITPAGKLVLLSSTLVHNSGGSSTVFSRGGHASIGNSIVMGGFGGGYLVSLGYNLVSGPGTPFNGPGDVVGISDPGLAPLGYYGGSTLIHPPAFDSVHVIDKGKASLGGVTLTTDQHGNPRPVRAHWQDPAPDGDFSDIGAVELGEMPQSGGTVVVNTTDDTDDGVPGKLHCSLREALNHVNGLAEKDEHLIRFDPRVFGPGKPRRTISLLAPLPAVRDTKIEGPGAKHVVILPGVKAKFPLLHVDGFVSSSISGLTLQNGQAASGAGIYSSVPLTVEDCHIRDCQADGQGGGLFCKAGGLVMRGCTFSNNRAGNGGAGIAIALSVAPSQIENSTFDGNRAVGGFGGGIQASGELTVTACTLTRGYAARAGGGIAARGGEETMITLGNCIVSGNEHSDVCGLGSYTLSGFASGGYNLIGTLFYRPGFTDGVNGDQVGVTSPRLGPLRDNGGPTPTVALLPGSPAIDKGHAFGLLTDQRGLARTFDHPFVHASRGGDETDAGAFELQRLTLVEWCRQYFTDEQLASAIGHPEGDANASGIPNALKHLFGIDPLQPMDAADRAALPRLSDTESGGRKYLVISYRRSGLYSGPGELVEYSTDLATWTPAPRFITSTGPVDPVTFDRKVEVWVDMTGVPNAYLRVSVP